MPTPSDDGDLPDGAADLVRRRVEEEHGYLSWLGTRVESVERGRIVMTVPYDEKLTNATTPPTVHGGVAATLVDTAGGIALRTTLDDPLAGGVATVNLNVNYLRRASGDLTATAEVVRAGGTIGVSEMTVEGPTPDGGTEAVATGQAAYRLFR
ncbi:PaaI family thioesterase [Halegenticoccus soli]|uniref:PaaI family thioesterase n=1 Tax=Halegenticoccus soli TaxID=1985678 RepID=UPI000C6D2161|nr:PaaI family thioesterase [Halegenticoccus soli]